MRFASAFTHAGPAPSSLIAHGPHNDCACASRPPAGTFKPPTHSCEDLKLRAQPSSSSGVATPLSASDHNVQAPKPKARHFDLVFRALRSEGFEPTTFPFCKLLLKYQESFKGFL
jgi:hypothetical protein